MNESTRVLIADDHQMVVDGFSSLLASEEDITVVASAADGKKVIDLLPDNPVDVAVLDFEMPNMDGVEVTAHIRDKYPDMKVIICTMHGNREKILEAMETKPDGYILKELGGDELCDAIRSVRIGRKFYSTKVQDILLQQITTKPDDSLDKDGLIRLTRREKEVLGLLAQGMTSKNMAEELFVAVSTIETHRRNLLDKTGAKNSRELIVMAINKGWIQNETE
ncbi:MAG TPA: hypothetical protein DCR93_06310 [Cytophagales bacterium]|nr:hypothetical protein [Cytophagales bacterium]HAP59123.1 hypothetical protein [Cytophagales bacterium]